MVLIIHQVKDYTPTAWLEVLALQSAEYKNGLSSLFGVQGITLNRRRLKLL